MEFKKLTKGWFWSALCSFMGRVHFFFIKWKKNFQTLFIFGTPRLAESEPVSLI